MKRLTLVIVVLLLALSLACGGSKETPEATKAPDATAEKTVAATAEKTVEKTVAATAEKTEEATKAPETEEPKGQPSGSTGAIHIDSGAFEELESYRSSMSIAFTPDDGDTGEIHLTQEMSSDPAAHRVLMSIVGAFPGTEEMTDGASLEIEVIMIEDKQWMRFGDAWMQTSVDSGSAVDMNNMAGMQDTFINPENLNSLSEDDLKFVGNEKINGVNTKHYSAEYDSLWGKLGMEGEDIESGSADIWVADESNLPQFVMKMEFEVKGKLDIGETGEKVDGTMVMEMEVTDVNEPVTIEAPEDALSGGMPEDVPEYPNAEDMSALGDMVMFTTSDSVDDVTAFYDEAMEEAGWTAGEASILGSTWTKDGRSLDLMVTEDDSTKKTSVIIMVSEEE
ncbi:MAG: hypothetical protein JXA21_24950 [Anaerolineae bacterium]|nr:hypothetical protein [Anaerolineae bacterium]